VAKRSRHFCGEHCRAKVAVHQPAWIALTASSHSNSLDRLFSFFGENLIQEREIVQVRQIRHLPAQKSSFKSGVR